MKSFKKSISILLVCILLSLFTSCINDTINKNESEQLAKTEITKSEDTKKNIETIVETTEDSENDDTFSDVTSLSKKEVENFASRIKNYYINNDFESISKIMLYPIYYDKEIGDFSLRSGGVKINNEKEFLDLSKDLSFTSENIEIMNNALLSDLWPQPSSGGISFGEGLVWFKDNNFDGVSMKTIGDADLKIFSLSGCK